MKKFKYTAFLLIAVMLLNISVFALDYANDNTAETINITETSAALTYPELLSADRLEKPHTERLYEKEASLLNAAIYKNSDDTITTYLFSEDVKYVDSNGNVRDKSTVLSLDGKGNYSTKDNNVISTLPQKITDGFTLSYGEYNVKVVPQFSGKLTEVSNARLKDNALLYSGVYGNETTVKYTPLLSGLKEDVILDKPTTDISLVYTLYTDGLTLKNIDNVSLSLSGDSKDFSLDISPIEIYDSAGNVTYGEYKVTELTAGEKYRLEIIPDKEFLASPDTVYPVTIDPSYTINSSSGSTKNIMDAFLYSAATTTNTGIYTYTSVGNMNNSTYGYARTIMRLPGLMNYINSQDLSFSDITSVNLNICCLSVSSPLTVKVNQHNGSAGWNESTVTTANNGIGHSIGYTTKAVSSIGWLSIDLLNAVDMWLQDSNGTLAAKGLNLRSDAESDTSKLVRFYSSESQSAAPYITITYNSGPTIPSNAIAVLVTTSSGAVIPNAVVYALAPKNSSGNYPAPVYGRTDSSGLVILTVPNTAVSYGVNVIAPGMECKSFHELISPSSTVHTMQLASLNPNLNEPIVGFSPANSWAHSIYTGCDSTCRSTFSQMLCPHAFFRSGQCFGWRQYNGLEFHQGIDITATETTMLYNVFTGNTTVIKAGMMNAYGNTVQLRYNGQYATYMHLSQIAISGVLPFSIDPMQYIGRAGTTGASEGVHLHISIASSETLYTTLPSMFSTFDYPLSYFN